MTTKRAAGRDREAPRARNSLAVAIETTEHGAGARVAPEERAGEAGEEGDRPLPSMPNGAGQTGVGGARPLALRRAGGATGGYSPHT